MWRDYINCKGLDRYLGHCLKNAPAAEDVESVKALRDPSGIAISLEQGACVMHTEAGQSIAKVTRDQTEVLKVERKP